MAVKKKSPADLSDMPRRDFFLGYDGNVGRKLVQRVENVSFCFLVSVGNRRLVVFPPLRDRSLRIMAQDNFSGVIGDLCEINGFVARALHRLEAAQRALAACQKGSNRRQRARPRPVRNRAWRR